MKNENSSETEPIETKPIFIPWYYWPISIGILIAGIIIWTYFMHQEFGNYKKMLVTLPAMLGSVGGIFAAVMGAIGARNGAFSDLRRSRGGTMYYSTRYGRWRLRKIINKFDSVSNEEMFKKALSIQRLQDSDVDGNQATENSHNSIYWKCVFCLQESDFDFVKVWNDFNYYEAMVSKSRWVKKYCFRLKRYIYCRILEVKDEVRDF